MRNLEDCKAEVFRRSEERIKERKRKRNRVLAWCIPLCLLLVAGGLYIRPLLEPVDEVARTNEGPTPVPGRELGGLAGGTVSYSSVDLMVRKGETEVFRNVTKEEAVEALYLAVAENFRVPVASSPETEVNVYGSTEDGVGDKTSGTVKENFQNTAGQDRDSIIDELKVKYELVDKPADYKLVFQTEGGAEFIYRLCGNVLYDDKNASSVTLDDIQLTVLRTKIEVVAADEDRK